MAQGFVPIFQHVHYMLYQSTIAFSCMANCFGLSFQEDIIERLKMAQSPFSAEKTW